MALSFQGSDLRWHAARWRFLLYMAGRTQGFYMGRGGVGWGWIERCAACVSWWCCLADSTLMLPGVFSFIAGVDAHRVVFVCLNRPFWIECFLPRRPPSRVPGGQPPLGVVHS